MTLSTKRFLNRANGSRKKMRYTRPSPAAALGELKYNSQLTTVGVNNPIDGFSLLRISQGTGRDQRIGTQIRVKRIEVSLPGNRGGESCTNAFMYSRKGAKSRVLGLTRPIEMPDNTRYRVWAHKNEKESNQLLNIQSADVDPSTTPQVTLKKNFAMPMKVTFDEDSMDNEILTNGVYLAWYVSSFFAASQSTVNQQTGDPAEIRVWYYDA